MRMNYRELINREIADTLISLFRSILTSGRLPDCLKDFHEHDIAQAMEELEPDERRKLCGILGARLSADIFPYFDEPGLRLAELSPEFAAAVADAMDTDEAMEILDETPAPFRARLAPYLQPETAEELRLLLSYEDEEIGSRMSTNYISILRSLSVKEAMRELIRQSEENDNISTLYVVDSQGFFCGAIELKDLILAREGSSLEECTVTSYPFVRDHDSMEEAMDWAVDYEEDSLPVLDQDGRLLGVITAQEVVDYLEHASKDVVGRLAGISDGEDGDEDLRETLAVSSAMAWPSCSARPAAICIRRRISSWSREISPSPASPRASRWPAIFCSSSSLWPLCRSDLFFTSASCSASSSSCLWTSRWSSCSLSRSSSPDFRRSISCSAARIPVRSSR